MITSIINQKGGTGKTTTTVNLGSALATKGKSVLLVDLDPQGNLSYSLGINDFAHSIDEVMLNEVSLKAALVQRENMDVIPTGRALSKIEFMGHQEGMATEFLLRNALQQAAEYDHILIDCPPSLSLVSYAALSASDFCLIPLEAARWGALGTQQIVSAIEYVAGSSNSNLQLLGYVVSRFKVRRSYQQTYHDQLASHFGELAFQTAIPDLADFEKAVTDRVPMTLHSPTSHASEIARNFYNEVERRCQELATSRRIIGDQRLPASARPSAKP